MKFLKENWNFREFKIEQRGEYYEILKKLYKVIEELERKKLINGFHFILHENIDLRLSCDNWLKKEDDIVIILKKSGFFDDNYHKWEMSKKKYNGKRGLLVYYNCLEYNSRLIFEIARYFKKKIKIFCQCRHYLSAQFGYRNDYEQYVNAHEVSNFLELCWKRRVKNETL